jgi:hypothetical protein
VIQAFHKEYLYDKCFIQLPSLLSGALEAIDHFLLLELQFFSSSIQALIESPIWPALIQLFWTY